MKYTFDEAFKCVKENSFIQSYEDIYEYNHVIDLDDVIDILEKLREEYAPTIEMTKEQARVLNEYREPYLYDEDCAFYVFFDETCVPRLNSMRDTSLYGNLTEAQLMQAWVHHDDIKIIDKE